MKCIWISIFLFYYFLTPVLGQDTARIYVRTWVQKDAVLLRWAVSTPLAWKQTNRSGFRLERYTVVRDGKLLESPEKTLLSEEVIKAKPLDYWVPLLEKNDNAGIIAQALYGDEFELTGGDAQGLARIVNLAQELEQRFTFSLYAADQDFEMACMAGWGWRDVTAKKGERYLYRVVVGCPENSTRITPGSTYISLDEYRPLPRPIGLEGVWNDRSVLLNWSYGILAGYYNSYYIEKSADGKIFRRLAGPPVSNLNNRDSKLSERIVYVDSLADNTQTYYYRVRGITTFGEIGPPSDTVSGKGVRTLDYVPVVRKAVIDGQGKLDIEWDFAVEGNELIEGFELRRSDKANGTYRAVMKEISPGLRRLKYADVGASNYFTIAAIPFEGKERVSYPVLVQPLDTIPPARPQGLNGRIDSLGKVTLYWNRNTESDLLGYKVYRANLKDEEPYPLMDIAWPDSCYTDSVQISSLNSEVFYYVVALDKRYNHSPLSGRLDLTKPDIIPPLSPLINDYRVTPRGIEIHWIPSPDEDVAQHLLFRCEKGKDSISLLIGRFPDNTVVQYVDTVFDAGRRYEYSIYAEDKSGLRSEPTPSVVVNAPKVRTGGQVIDRFDAVVDKTNLLIKLEWSGNLKSVKSYELYRKEGDMSMTMWKVLPGWQTEVMDENISVGVKYEYMIRAMFEEGGNSQVKTIVIK